MNEIDLKETSEARIDRLMKCKDLGDANADIQFLLGLLQESMDREVGFRETIDNLKATPGRVVGLREAAGLVRAACNKDVVTRIMVGKKEHAVRSINAKLLDNVARLIDRYAADAEAGKI